ncbi:MAG: nuclear transport factor 2 family protein [Holophagales bacterium]|nr:nuclear transport factor 2 family protein [Holophagales bacterium]
MRRIVPAAAAIAAFLALSAAPALGQEKPRAFASYAEMRAEAGRLSNDEKYAEAAAILEKAIDAYPDRLRANTYNLALMRVRLGEPENAAEALELGLSRGAWYGKFDFFAELWAPLKALPRFAEIERRCEARRAEAEKLLKPRLDVAVPPGARAGAKLPLFIALHGGGENVDAFRPHWTSPLLEQGFVVAYPQSTQLVAPDGYDWMQDAPRTLRELKDVYTRLVADYPVDASRVVVGGFSSGGAAALEVVAAGTFPVSGFVSLCPPRPPGLTAEKARAAASRGVKGTLLTTERDGRLADQKEMAELMRGAGLLVDFVVTPDIGHWYPADLAARIDSTLRAVVPLGLPGAAGERAVVEAAIRDSIGWALGKDRARLESILTHDDDLFIFHPDSKSNVSGWAAFSKLLDGFMDPRFVATRFEVRDLAITFSRGGDVAWFSTLLEDCGTWEGKESCWKDTRWTGVLEKRGGTWRIVQMHFSFARDKVLAECPVPAA